MSQIFDSLGKTPQAQNPIQMIQQLKSDPAGFLRNKGFNVPDGVDLHNPQSIINALVQSGQISGNAYQVAMRRMMGAGRR